MPKKPHPADQADRDAISTATRFIVHMRRGPADVFKQEAATLPDAIAIADQVRAENKGRDCLVYAIAPEGNSIPVPKVMQRAGGWRLVKSDADAGQKPKPATKPVNKAEGGRPKGRRAEIAENAAKGIVPPVPDFTAPTHARFRKHLAEIVVMVEACNIASLKAMVINPVSSSPKAMARYRDLAVIALGARQQNGATTDWGKHSGRLQECRRPIPGR